MRERKKAEVGRVVVQSACRHFNGETEERDKQKESREIKKQTMKLMVF